MAQSWTQNVGAYNQGVRVPRSWDQLEYLMAAISPYPIVHRVTIVKYTASTGLKVVVPLKLPLVMYTVTPVATYKKTPRKDSLTIEVDDLCGSDGS